MPFSTFFLCEIFVTLITFHLQLLTIMNRLNMVFKATLPWCLVVTNFTWVFYSSMNWFNVHIKCIFSVVLLFTFLAWKMLIRMHSFNMRFKTAFECKLKCTEFTTILHAIMSRFNVQCVALYSHSLVAWKLYTFVNCSNMYFNTIIERSLVITTLGTRILWKFKL